MKTLLKIINSTHKKLYRQGCQSLGKWENVPIFMESSRNNPVEQLQSLLWIKHSNVFICIDWLVGGGLTVCVWQNRLLGEFDLSLWTMKSHFLKCFYNTNSCTKHKLLQHFTSLFCSLVTTQEHTFCFFYTNMLKQNEMWFALIIKPKKFRNVCWEMCGGSYG